MNLKETKSFKDLFQKQIMVYDVNMFVRTKGEFERTGIEIVTYWIT